MSTRVGSGKSASLDKIVVGVVLDALVNVLSAGQNLQPTVVLVLLTLLLRGKRRS